VLCLLKICESNEIIELSRTVSNLMAACWVLTHRILIAGSQISHHIHRQRSAIPASTSTNATNHKHSKYASEQQGLKSSS
jgi:hypothetical protein